MSLKYELKLDPKFQPMIVELREFKNRVALADEKAHVAFCVERNNGYRYRYELDVIPGDKANVKMVERLLKSILWVVGGYKIYISGPKDLTDAILDIFSMKGSRAFDVEFMSRVYRNQFEVLVVDEKDVPASKEASIKVGGHLDGCRIGFDAGGSDRKVSAVVNGEVIYSEEVVWFPKTNEDPDYHYNGILESFKTAASKMPRVDAIGACIGERSSRITRMMKELNGEKLDIVLYDKDPVQFIKNALSPAKNVNVLIMDPKENVAMAVADGDQLSLAIGKKGQNVRLASRLTKYRIDVKTSADLKEMGINIGFE